MRYIIRENEVGFLSRNGKFQRLLNAGKYNFWKKSGYELKIVEAAGEVKSDGIPYEVLQKDEEFRNATVRYEIDTDEIGFLYINGKLMGISNKGDYVFWKRFEKVEMKIYSMKELKLQEELTKDMIQCIPKMFYTQVAVGQGEEALVYVNNTLTEKLGAGLYYYWNVVRDVKAVVVDMKWREISVAGQEILTKDKVGIRLNMVTSYKVTDAEKSISDRTNMTDQLYSFIQMVSRELIGNYKLDEILERRSEISEILDRKLREGEKDFYIEFGSFGIKDIILPGEIKEIMNTVLVAEKKAQANVIERREEVASTRSLMNTAKLMDENQTLFQLKKLEYLERICNRVGEISVSGKGDLIEQLSQLI